MRYSKNRYYRDFEIETSAPKQLNLKKPISVGIHDMLKDLLDFFYKIYIFLKKPIDFIKKMI